MKKKSNESQYEIVIEYQSPYSKGTMIIDSNFYTKHNKKIQKALKDCEVLSMIERKKDNAQPRKMRFRN